MRGAAGIEVGARWHERSGSMMTARGRNDDDSDDQWGVKEKLDLGESVRDSRGNRPSP